MYRFLEKLLILSPVCRRVYRVCSKMLTKAVHTLRVPGVTFGVYNIICCKRQVGARVLRAALSIIQTPFSPPPHSVKGARIYGGLLSGKGGRIYGGLLSGKGGRI